MDARQLQAYIVMGWWSFGALLIHDALTDIPDSVLGQRPVIAIIAVAWPIWLLPAVFYKWTTEYLTRRQSTRS